MKKTGWALAFVSILMVFGASQASAGVFNLPHFVSPGEFALGFEAELTLTHGAGIGGNFRYTHGLNELMNVVGIIGTGTEPRKFRVGGATVFDFFPDIDNQPGIGIAAQGLYYRLGQDGTTTGQFELTGVPYIHKAFLSGSNEIEPYLSVPFGMGFSEGRYKWLTQMAVGAMFSTLEHFRYTMEFGIAINNTETYIAGGVTYYH